MYGGALAQITKRAKASKEAKDAKERPKSPRSPANARKPIRAASMWQSRASVNKTSKADIGTSGKMGALSRKNKSNFGITMGDIVDEESSSDSEGATSAVAHVADRSTKDRRRRRHDSGGEPAPTLKKTHSGHAAAGVLALGMALRTDTDGSDKEKKARVPRPIGQYRSRSVLDQLDSPPSGAANSGDAPTTSSNLFSRSSLRTSRKIGMSRRSSDLGMRSGSSRLLDSPSESNWGGSNRLTRKASRISVHTGGRDSNEVSSKPGEEVGGGVELDGLSQVNGGAVRSRGRSSSGSSSGSGSRSRRTSSQSSDSRPPHHVAGDDDSLDSYQPDDNLAEVYRDMPDSASQWGGAGGGRKRVTRALLSEEDVAKRRKRSTNSIKTYFPVTDTIVREYGAVWSRYYKFVVRGREKYPDGFAPYDTARLQPESSGCSHWWYYAAPWARHIRSRIYLTLSEPSTGRAAQWFSIFVMLVIILSSVTFVIESYPQYRIESEVNGNANTTFVLIELVAVIIFTMEYLSRLLTVSAYPTVPELTDMNTFMVHMEYAISAAVAEQAEERQAQARDAWMAELQQNARRRSEEEYRAGAESPMRSAVASPGVATPNVAAPGNKGLVGKQPQASLNAWGEKPASSVGGDSMEEEVIEHLDSKAMDPVQRVLHGLQEHTPAQDAVAQGKSERKGGLRGGAPSAGGGEMARLVKSPTGLTTAATNKEALGAVENPHALGSGNRPSRSASSTPWWKQKAPPPPPVYDRTCCGACRSDTPSKVYAFLRSPINMIDLLAILPFYIELAVGGAAGNVGLTVFRILRLGRIFRIFKLSKYSTGMQLMGRVIVASADAMGLLLFFITIGVIVFGSIMFFAEAGEYDEATGVYMRRAFTGDDMEPTPFTSIPMAFWYVVVTATTVGYGEMVPTSTIGRMVGVLVMLAGILVLALPITVFGAQFAVEYATATEEENEAEEDEGEHYAYDEYGNPYYIGPGADDADGPALPDDVSVVLTPEALKAAHMGDAARGKSFAHLEPETLSTRRRSEAGDLLRKVGAPPMMIQAQGGGDGTPESEAEQDLLTIHEGSRDETTSNMGSGHLPVKHSSPRLGETVPAQGSERDLLQDGSMQSMSAWNSMQNGTSMASATPQATPRTSLRDMVAKVRASSARGSSSVAPTLTGGSDASPGLALTNSISLEHGVVSSGVVGSGGQSNQVVPMAALPAPVSSASGGENSSGQMGSADLQRIGSDHSFRGAAAAQSAGIGQPPGGSTRGSLPGGGVHAGEAKDFHAVSSRSRGGGAPFMIGGPPGPPRGPRPPAQQVNRHRHSMFGAPRDASPAKPRPERERKKQVTEHILANNPMAAAKVNAMRTAAGGAATAGPQSSLAAKPKAGVPAARSLSSTLVTGISDDAAAARRGVEELKNLIKGLSAELKNMRSDIKSLRSSRRRSLSTASRRDLPSTTGAENSTDDEGRAGGSNRGQSPAFSKGIESGGASPTASAARRVSAPAGVPAPSPTPSQDAEEFTGVGSSPGGEAKQAASVARKRVSASGGGTLPAVVAVDDARAVARDATGHMNAGTGSSASTPAEPADATAMLLARLDTLTEQITQRVAASVADSIDRQIDRRLEAAGVAPAQ